jgi:hypothetical protein
MTLLPLPILLLLAQQPTPQAQPQAQPLQRRGPNQQQQRQTPAAQQAELKPEDYGRIEGAVTNATTGEPIRRAEIQLVPLDRRSAEDATQTATTGADGRFSFSNVPPGRMILRPSRNGFVQKGGSSSIQLSNGQALTNVTLAMLPQAVVSGRVLDDEGEPLARASVTAYRYTYPQGRKTLAASESTTSNDLGEFRLWGLSRGTYYIAATPRSGWNGRAGPRGVRPVAADGETLAPTFHPSAVGIASATPVRLTPGAQMPNIDIHVGKARTFRISGTIVDAATGQAVARASVVATPEGGVASIGQGQGQGPGRGGGENGQFTLTGLLPGSYTLQARTMGGRGGGGGSSLSGQLRVEIGAGDLTDLRIAMRAPASLAGYVKLDQGELDSAAWTSARLQLEPMQGGQMGPGSVSATIGEGGKFTAENLSALRYRLKLANVPAGFFLKAIRLGSLEVQETGIDLSTGIAAGSELGLIFSAGAGSIEGTVKDSKDQPSPKTTVVLVPRNLWAGYADAIKTVSSSADGSFQFAQLAPGEYELYAFEDAETGSWFDPDFRAANRDQAGTVRVEKGTAAKLDLKPIASP